MFADIAVLFCRRCQEDLPSSRPTNITLPANNSLLFLPTNTVNNNSNNSNSTRRISTRNSKCSSLNVIEPWRNYSRSKCKTRTLSKSWSSPLKKPIFSRWESLVMAFTSVLNGMHNIAQCFFFNFLFENYLHAYKKKISWTNHAPLYLRFWTSVCQLWLIPQRLRIRDAEAVDFWTASASASNRPV